MAKKKIQKPLVQPASAIPKVSPIFIWTPQIKYTLLLLLGFAFYANTLQNQYALDDGGVILANQYVQQGFGGIKKIMTSDAFASYLQKMGAGQHLSGGRYRPLSIVVFAIQQSLFGNSPFVRHLFNVLCFLATIFAMFYFLSKYMLKHIDHGEDIAFIATILFTIHPIHTEVVANIKSLDEILSLLFILCTLIMAAKYVEEHKKQYIIVGMVCYLLALLSKEYAIVMVVLLPLFFYLYPYAKKEKTWTYTWPYIIVFFIYLLMRFSAVGTPFNHPQHVVLLNNQLRVDPYYYATHVQKFATEWYSLGKYIVMLFFPYPLSCDYSYAQIPYHTLSNFSVWLSLFAYIIIAVWGVKMLRKKNILSFAIFFFLFTLLPVSNFFINIGAMFGERFAYHASFGFVVLLSYGLFYLFRNLSVQLKKGCLSGLMVVLILACGAEVIKRNTQWENNNTLFLADIHTAPHSAFVECNAAACYINLAQKQGYAMRKAGMLDTAIIWLYQAIKTDKTFPDPYINIGLAYYCAEQLDSAKHYWDFVQNGLYPNHPELKRFRPMLAKAYLAKGLALGKTGKVNEAIANIKKGTTEDPDNAELWYNLGGAYYTEHQLDAARAAWIKTLQINPQYTEAQQGLNAINNTKQ